jgi:serine protease
MFVTSSRALARICLAGATLGFAGVAALTAVPASGSASASAGTNPFLPSNGHGYRHGAIPTRAQQGQIRSWSAQHRSSQAGGAATGPNTLSFLDFSGGPAAVTSTPKVYLVFWGNQWGTQNTDGNGNLTFSADSANGAPYLQQMFKGLGTNNELWSGTMTQYCDGPLVQYLATSCPNGAPHIGYPSGSALAGVWYDNATSEPAAASASQIGSEALAAAVHFGNTTQGSNRYAQYVVASAPGLDPDNYLTSGFCAWHDWGSSSVGNLAFTNLPYVMDVGGSCGAGFVNSGGTLDGYSIVEGHEYAETLTDQFPNKGWVNASSGEENGDECAWISPGSSGGAADVTTATGSFAMQSTWSNDTNACAISHAVVTGSNPNTVMVTNPGSQSGTAGTATSLQIQASDSASGTPLTYSATGLPAGLGINSSSGLISGTPTTPATDNVTVTATDNTGAHGSASFSWTINQSGNVVTVTNPGSQTGTAGTASSLQIQASDSASGTPLTYSATGLPAGLGINSNSGLISGTPTTPATDNVTVTATDNTGSHGSASFSWTINPSGNTVTVNNPGTQTNAAGTSVGLQINATDSASGTTLTYSATGLPAGLSINSRTGLISGRSNSTNTYSVKVTVTDNTGAHGSASFSWTITKRHR